MLAKLFFGRAVQGRPPVSQREWEDFTEAVITPRFPEGFTVLEGQGQWRDPETGRLVQEDSKILLLSVTDQPAMLRRLDEIAAEWRRRFRQISVGRVTQRVCAAF